MTSKQHRCVFVGNIPYDASEEQLIRICEEVGPVVSFRLVLDRETGKPKGYGFCEYRDEETALSARRNLQGYEINGRQLRVDFAENEKGSAERNREQGRGGSGLQLSDAQKQGAGLKTARDPFLFQPMGFPAAASAAASMVGMFGGPQSGAGADALSSHLATMPRLQLYEVIFHMKNFIQQNQQQARLLLTAYPQLTKALLQAQIMLGLVRPHQPHMAGALPPLPSHQNIPQISGMRQGQLQMPGGVQQNQAVNIASQMNQISQNLQFPTPGPQHPQLSISAGVLVPNQPSALQGVQPQMPIVQRSQPQALPSVHLSQPPLPQLPRPPPIPPSPPQPQSSQVATLLLPPASQGVFQPSAMPHTNLGAPSLAMNPPLPSQPHPQQTLPISRNGSDAGGTLVGQGIQPGSTSVLTAPLNVNLVGGKVPNVGTPNVSTPSMIWSHTPPLSGPITSTGGFGMMGTGPSDLLKHGLALVHQPTVVQSQVHQQVPQLQGQQQHPQTSQQQQQQQQVMLEPEQQKALLQQVMNLTAEQIKSLPLEQQQQVFQLQQAVRNQAI